MAGNPSGATSTIFTLGHGTVPIPAAHSPFRQRKRLLAIYGITRSSRSPVLSRVVLRLLPQSISLSGISGKFMRKKKSLPVQRRKCHEGDWACPYESCTCSMVIKRSLEQHISTRHKDVERYSCLEEGCGMLLRPKSILNHMRWVHGKDYLG